jgi:predicted DNA-binding transcriptional regulator YafY
LKAQDDGSILLTIKCGINDYLVGWILGLGKSATVIGPQKLRQRIVGEAKGIVESYGGK